VIVIHVLFAKQNEQAQDEELHPHLTVNHLITLQELRRVELVVNDL
jgi:hypothetical protein